MDLSLNNYLVGPVVSTAVVMLALWWYAYRSQSRLHDAANERSLHQGEVMTGAGIFMFVPLCLIGLVQFPLFVPLYLISVLSVLGWFDDRYDLSTKLRFAIQLLVAFCLVFSVGLNIQIGLFLFLVVALLWWINLFNFMDGANGLAGMHAFISLGFYAWVFVGASNHVSVLHFLGVAGVLVILVYLLFNVVLKKLFMGDSGSLPMALLLATMALYLIRYGQLSYLQVAVIHAVFIVDATMTLFHRLINSENITHAHSTHLYQRLIKQGWSHIKLAVVYGLITAVCCWLAYIMSLPKIPVSALFVLVYALLIGIFMKTLRVGR